jgi:excisionase family DNA binding protein
LPQIEEQSPLPLLLSVSQAATLLNISRSKTYELVRSGELPSFKLGSTLRVPYEELRAYIKRRMAG